MPSPQKTANRPLRLRGCAHPERLRKLRIYFMDELKCVTAGMRRICSPPVQNQWQLRAQIYFGASAAVLKKKKSLFVCHQCTAIAGWGGFFFLGCSHEFIFFLRNSTYNQTSLQELRRNRGRQKYLQRQGSPAQCGGPEETELRTFASTSLSQSKRLVQQGK